MGTVNLIELPAIKSDQDGYKGDIQPLALKRQTIATSGSSAQSAALLDGTKIVRIKADTSVYVAWGSNPTATKVTATEQDFCPAGSSIDVVITSSDLKFAFIE